VFASRFAIPGICLVALVLATAGVEWASARQEATGRAGLTRAARRYLEGREVPGGEILLTKVETEVGARRGMTEFQIVRGTWRGPVVGENVTVEWVRDREGDWVPEETRRRR
jgi:hypothetical protein